MLRYSDLTEELSINMLKYECSLRNSDEIQKMYTEKKPSIEDFVQRKTLSNFGYDVNEENLEMYRQIGTKFKGNEKVYDAAFFLKYNIMENVPEGLKEKIVDAKLINLDGSETSLFNFVRNKPLVILSGSLS